MIREKDVLAFYVAFEQQLGKQFPSLYEYTEVSRGLSVAEGPP